MTKDLTRGTPWKLILQFALPIMAGNFLQQLYNTADTIIVGNFNGQQALSAVGACAAMTVLFTALAIGFSVGAGVLISQYFGAAREQELRQYAATSIVLMLAMGLLMSLIGVVSARFLLERALGTPEALLPLTLLYFRIYAAGLVFQFGYNIAAALLRALGDSKFAGAARLDAAVDGTEVVKAAPIEELAALMGVDADTLVKSVETYNTACATGNDTEFGKDASNLTAIDAAPYYAVRIYVCTGGTIAGVKTNLDFQVLREDGSVINGLYAGGETSNREMYAYAYSSGSGVGYALASGRQIGMNLMK